jgi:hypothetical protein
MVRCSRCDSGFSVLHSASEVNCPRCRIRDGVTAEFVPASSRSAGPIMVDPLSEMTRGYERGRARMGVGKAPLWR